MANPPAEARMATALQHVHTVAARFVPPARNIRPVAAPATRPATAAFLGVQDEPQAPATPTR